MSQGEKLAARAIGDAPPAGANSPVDSPAITIAPAIALRTISEE
jgi:hypothetical protein